MSATVAVQSAMTPVDATRDAVLLHTWMTHPRSAFWEMTHATVEEVKAAYEQIGADEYHNAFLGYLDGRAAFLAELYDPARREFVGVPEIRPGDVGMHLLVPAPDRPVHGFTRAARWRPSCESSLKTRRFTEW